MGKIRHLRLLRPEETPAAGLGQDELAVLLGEQDLRDGEQEVRPDTPQPKHLRKRREESSG